MASKVSGMIEQINALSGSNNVTHNIASTAYGYCETAAGTAAKVVDMTGFKLVEGVTIHVKFKEKNSASSPTLNVNGTGAKNIVQYGTTAVGTTSETNGWYAGAVISFTYDGTNWVRDQGFNTNTTYYYESCYSSTAASTAAKVAQASSYTLPTTAGHFAFWLLNSNTAASKLTLAIKNGSTAGTAKDIWINGAVTSSTNYTWPSGFYIGYYDGSVYHFRTDGKLPGSITGDAATVNGLTVQTAVPANAVFTDTKSFTITANATDGYWDLTGTNGTNSVTYALAPYSSKQSSANFYTGTTNPDGTTRLNYNGYLYATKLYSGGTEVSVSGHNHNSSYLTAVGYDSTNKKIYYTKNGSNTDVVTFGSNAFNSTSYLPLAGGTMTGDIVFATIGSYPVVEGETYPISSKGISWAGSSDSAKIFYRIDSGNNGNLIIQTSDDGNEKVIFRTTQTNGDFVAINSNDRYIYPINNNTGYVGTSNNKFAGMYATTFYGALSGNASTATEFSAGTTVKLTGNVTGESSSSKKGWSIATTIGTGVVTNAMLAGSIANGKLSNSKITINSKVINLGDSVSLADIGAASSTTVDGLLAAADAMIFKGTIGTNGTVTSLPATHNAGDTYRVITAGTWAGKYCEVGTLIICVKDGTAAADADWTSVETNEDGAVISSSTDPTDNAIARFDGTSGRIIQKSGITIDDNGNLVISHATNATMTTASTNPQIIFSENGGQPVHLIYTDYDSYRSPAGLKIIGGTSATPAWLEVEGNIYAAAFKGNADTATTATNLANNPSIQTSGTTQITITAGGKTSSAYTVPYATSAGSATSASVLNNYYSSRQTDANIAHVQNGGIRHFKATSSMTSNKPMSDGSILHFFWDNENAWNSQLYIPDSHNNVSMQWRGSTAAGTWGTWKTLLDSNNTASGTNNAATLTWNTTYTIAKINGTDIKFTTMAKPSPSDIGAATSGHTHTLSIAEDSGTNALTLAYGKKYKLTAGGSTYIFTMPASDNTNTASAVDNILDGSNSGTAITYAPYSAQQAKLSFDTSTTAPSRTDRLNLNGYLYATKLYSGGTEVSVSGHTHDYIPLNTAGGIARCSGNGNYRYCTVATINTNEAYINGPMVLEVSGRDIPFTRLQIRFVNSGSVDPGLSSFITNYSAVFYIKKTNTNEWTIYCDTLGTWNSLVLHRITGVESSKITPIMTQTLTALPEGCTQVSYGGNVATATSSSKTTAANITSTSNAIAYYTNTTGTFGSKASANGALYATSANGALQWGTLPIAQGGTGKTTASEAWTALGGGDSGKHANSYFIKAVTSTDNAIVRFDSTSGQVQNSKATLDDNGYITLTHIAGSGYGELKIIYSSTISMWWGVGTGNENHGLYDDKASGGAKWILYAGTDNLWTFVGNVTGNVSGSSGSCTGLAAKATADASGNTITSYYCTLSTTQTLSGAKTFSAALVAQGNVTVGTTTAGALGLAQTDGLGLGISLYGGPKAKGALEYGIMFAKTATFGKLGSVSSDWATYFTMNRNDARGWIFKSNGGASNGNNNVTSIAANGNIYTIGNITVGSNATLQWNATDQSLDFIFN